MVTTLLVIVAVVGWIGCIAFGKSDFDEFNKRMELMDRLNEAIIGRDAANLREDALEHKAFKYKKRLEKALGRKVK